MNTCVNCGEKYDNIDEHKKHCKSSFISKEFENLIPCEICNTLVNFEDYNEHLSMCNSPLNNIGLQNELFSIFDIPVNNNLQEEDINNEEELEYSINIENDNLNNFNNLNNQLINIFGNIIGNLENSNFSVNNIDNEEDSYENLNNISETIGDVNVGVIDIDKYLRNYENKITCPICCIDFDSGVETKCNHKFCKDCITEWLKENNKCPICLYEFIEK